MKNGLSPDKKKEDLGTPMGSLDLELKGFGLSFTDTYPKGQRKLFYTAEEIEADLDAIEARLLEGPRSQLPLPQKLSLDSIKSGGKRLRPYLVALSYRSTLGKKAPSEAPCDLAGMHLLASVAEWVHTATLFHDDVLDASPERRKQPSAHVLHGNKNAILVGDLVYVEAFALLMEAAYLEPSKHLAYTIKKLVEGELMQHHESQQRDLDLERHTLIAKAKTASLFEWCMQTGAWAAGGTAAEIQAAAELGQELGYLFQLIDDVLDTFELDAVTSSQEERIEWASSSAPWPIVLCAEDSETRLRWKKLCTLSAEELGPEIKELQKAALSKKDLIATLLRQELKHCRDLSRKVPVATAFDMALELLEQRSEESLHLMFNKENTQ